MKLVLILCLCIPSLLKAQTKAPIKKTAAAGSNPLKLSLERGKTVYATYCLSCHQADGSGVPNLNPPLTKNQWTLGSKTVLITQILKGSSGKVEIDGDTFSNTMPPLPVLSDQQIADVLTYVRNNFGNKASVVSVAEVKAVRAKTK